MLNLSLSQDSSNMLNFERVNEMDDNLLKYWTGQTKEEYFNKYIESNQSSADMQRGKHCIGSLFN